MVVGELMLDVLFVAGRSGPSGPHSQSGPSGLYVRAGGSAATAALTLAAARGPEPDVVVIGKTGPDPNGRWLCESLASAGVALRVAPASAMATGFVVIHRRGRADRVVYVERGANRLLDPADLGGGGLPSGAAWLHVSGYNLLEPGPAGTVRLLAGQARRAGVPVSLDTGVPQAYRRLAGGSAVRLKELFSLGLAGGPDFLLPSAGMAQHLAGGAVGDASLRLARTFRGVVVKDGPGGAWVGDRNIPLEASPPTAGADVNGAGDVFDGAFIAAALEGLSGAEAAGRANAAAAAYVAESLAGRPVGGWRRVSRQEPPILVSACLFDTLSAYDGLPKPSIHGGRAVPTERLHLPICPEQLGGLATPRPPAEIARTGATARAASEAAPRAGEAAAPFDGHAVLRGEVAVLDSGGRDVTEAFLKGARRAAELARATGAGLAVLREGSPSCGSSQVHDGSFSGRRVPGRGVAAAVLAEMGVRVVSGEAPA